jgi:hypothetical protein
MVVLGAGIGGLLYKEDIFRSAQRFKEHAPFLLSLPCWLILLGRQDSSEISGRLALKWAARFE